MTIVTSATANPSELLLTVQDSGVGIADDDLPRVTDRFYRVLSAI